MTAADCADVTKSAFCIFLKKNCSFELFCVCLASHIIDRLSACIVYTQTSVDPVKCVRMVNSVDYVVAVGHASGLIGVFQLQSALPAANNTVRID